MRQASIQQGIREMWPAVLAIFLNTSVVVGEDFERSAWELDGPVILPWKTIEPDQAYHGQWLVAGDLDADGQAEIVSARQIKQRVTAVVATRLDGAVLWRWGEADAGSPVLAYDVPVQIFDLDGDGRPEVYLSIEKELIVLEGPTGKEARRLPLPEGLEVADCIVFANLRGGPRARDIIVKDRYRQLWAYTDEWKLLWHWQPPQYMTCHHPRLIDIDGDGRDEVMGGYTLLDDDGRELWTMTSEKINLGRGHLDCCEVVRAGSRPQDFRLVVSCCGANGIAMLDGRGRTIWDVAGHHFESIDIGRVVPGSSEPQIVVDIAHQPYRKGSLWVMDAQGNRLGSYLCGDSRHHRLIDWDGDGVDEILVGQTQRLLNARGECVARLGPVDAFHRATPVPPDEDHEPFGLVGDMDGDARPEILLYSQTKILIYRSEKAARVPALRLGTGVNVTLY